MNRKIFSPSIPNAPARVEPRIFASTAAVRAMREMFFKIDKESRKAGIGGTCRRGLADSIKPRALSAHVSNISAGCRKHISRIPAFLLSSLILPSPRLCASAADKF
jgi:hypothetical protein